MSQLEVESFDAFTDGSNVLAAGVVVVKQSSMSCKYDFFVFSEEFEFPFYCRFFDFSEFNFSLDSLIFVGFDLGYPSFTFRYFLN